MTKTKAKMAEEEAAKKRGRGRPRVITDVHVKTVRAMAARGWTEIEMAAALDISIMTFRRWKVDFPDFLLAATPTVEEQIAAVKAALLSRATGFQHPAVKIMTVAVGGGVSQVVREEYVEHYPPDVSAIQFFLKNRDPDNWRDRQEVDQKTDATVRIEGGLPDKET